MCADASVRPAVAVCSSSSSDVGSGAGGNDANARTGTILTGTVTIAKDALVEIAAGAHRVRHIYTKGNEVLEGTPPPRITGKVTAPIADARPR